MTETRYGKAHGKLAADWAAASVPVAAEPAGPAFDRIEG